ncbi:DUF4405 domain-containing protein [Hippea alviniae]|uniref:DUF4405 domain-containing protein n=1 Tax=Hippea alviniae TaxID=1279027 RepID=UPI0003B68518|nr:DUF4405 domain-containing protein [Hippea alviniae]
MSLRRFTSLIMLFSFIVMSFTGIVLFFVPQGKVAYWTGWKFLGLTKTQYSDIHVSFMVLFLIFGVIHVYLNWNAIVNYLKNKARKISFTRLEFLLSLIVSVVFFLGGLYHFQPFKSYFDFETYLKDSWIKSPDYQPPYGHAEESSLRVFCKRVSIDLNEAMKILSEKGIRVESADESLKEIAKKNNTTPMNIYIAIKALKKSDEPTISFGIGKKTIKELASEGVIKFGKVKAYLKEKGVEINPDDTLKSVAEKLDTTPKELLDRLKEISK